MNRLEFIYQERQIRITLGKINLFFGSSACGKTRFAKYLEKALTGVEKSFQLNSQPVTRSQFQVKLIAGNQSIADELKLSSKSELNRIIKETINNDFTSEQLDKITSALVMALEGITNALNNKLRFLGGNQDNYFQCRFDFGDVLNLIKNHFEILSLDGLSDSTLREIYLRAIIRCNNSDKEAFLIVDDADEKIDLNQFINLVEDIEKCKNMTTILLLKNPEFIYYLSECYPVFLVQKDFIELKDFIHYKVDTMVNRNLTYPIFIDSDIKMIEESIYSNLLREIISLILIKDEQEFLKRYKYRLLMSSEKTKFLKNFIQKT